MNNIGYRLSNGDLVHTRCRAKHQAKFPLNKFPGMEAALHQGHPESGRPCAHCSKPLVKEPKAKQ